MKYFKATGLSLPNEPIELLRSISQLVTEQVESNIICEAWDCNEVATKTIGVNAGTYGVIQLYVCRDCISKFEDTST